MGEYRRPQLSRQSYRDGEGRAIEYGRRWKGDSPPDVAYSRVDHPERFAPLHVVAAALIEWLRSTFDVVVEQGQEMAVDLIRQPDEVTEAVRIIPRNPTAARLTFVLTSFPGVYLHAGSLHDFHFPVCGCDACDDEVEDLVDDFEWTVRTVVKGGYSEHLDTWPAHSVEYRLNDPGLGIQSGRTGIEELPEGRVKVAQTAIPGNGQWVPWEKPPKDDTVN